MPQDFLQSCAGCQVFGLACAECDFVLFSRASGYWAAVGDLNLSCLLRADFAFGAVSVCEGFVYGFFVAVVVCDAVCGCAF